MAVMLEILATRFAALSARPGYLLKPLRGKVLRAHVRGVEARVGRDVRDQAARIAALSVRLAIFSSRFAARC